MVRISNINPYYNYRNTNIANNKISRSQAANSISFENVWNGSPEHTCLYAYCRAANPELAPIVQHQTSVYRSLVTKIKMAKMLDKHKKTQIKVLGCSDGSAVWAWGIAMAENRTPKQLKNISIEGIDRAPYMVEAACLGGVVFEEAERKRIDSCFPRSNYSVSDKYFLPAEAIPDKFHDVSDRYPDARMTYMYSNTVLKAIKEHAMWNKVNAQLLPQATFKVGDMLECTAPNEESDVVVYSIENSISYSLSETHDVKYFIDVLRKIKEDCREKKEVYIVFGSSELCFLENTKSIYPNYPYEKREELLDAMDEMGYKKLDDVTITQYGLKNYDNSADKIYRLIPVSKAYGLKR